ncbi:MAG: hypothetical protein QOC79_1923, partial [Actinomycetota bacterium]|nr:hypothetical protein [Actinomycetota bacterium]
MALISNVVQGSSSVRLALLIHGYGADERDLGGLLTYLDPNGELAAVLPRGPYPVPGTQGYSWYAFGGQDTEGTYESSLAELADLLDEHSAALGFERSQSIVGGFSQGA